MAMKEIVVSTTPEPAVVELHGRAVEAFRSLVHRVPVDAWSAPTPCADWDVRTLVNHVAGEELWTVPLLEQSGLSGRDLPPAGCRQTRG
jgi:uncharacterized protein (TIGR03083 family)